MFGFQQFSFKQFMSHLLTPPAYTCTFCCRQVPVTPSAAEYRRYSSLSTHSDEARVERRHGTDVTDAAAAGRSRRATVSSQPANHSAACSVTRFCMQLECVFFALHARDCVVLVCVAILTVVARL